MSTVADFFGADPARIVWKIVRGDSSTIKIDFLENDEATGFDTTGWDYMAIAYNPRTDSEYELEVSVNDSSISITAPADVTAEWGTTYGSVVAELLFDLEVNTGDEIWTPILGTISVLGDVGGSL
jgi:hypothetical protein